MEIDEQIRMRLKKMASDVGPSATLLAQVKSVNEAELLCDLYDDDSGLDFFDVRLRPIIDATKSLTLIPKVDAWVLAVRLEDSDDWAIIWASEFDKVLLNCDQITINNGAKGGLVNVLDLVSKINLIENKLNSFMNTYNTHVHSGVTTGPGSSAVTPQLIVGVLANTVRADLEDSKVTH